MTLYPPSTTMPVYAILTAAGIVLTCMRFWVRLSFSREPYARNALYLDDLFIVIGLLIVATCVAIQFYNATRGGSGEIISDPSKVAKLLVEYKIDFAMLVIEKPAFGAIKLSLLFFYRRIFGFWPSFRILNNILIWLVALWTMSFFLADIFLCGTHPQIHWALNQRIGLKKCGDKGALLIAFAATSVLTDLLVLLLPLLYIRRLRLRRSKKTAVSVVFLLGGISTMAGTLRLIFLCIAYPMGRLTWGYESAAPSDDKKSLFLQICNPTFWVMVEMGLGVWAANLPVLAPLVRAMKERYKASLLYKKWSRLVVVNKPKNNPPVDVQTTPPFLELYDVSEDAPRK